MFCRQNFLRINIYFEELNMEKITYSEYYAVSISVSENMYSIFTCVNQTEWVQKIIY